jgi:nitrite reductase/ring-hydroxylating ferredoxin subunit
MLVPIGNAKDIAAGEMRVFDLAGTKVNVANIDGQLHAFDDTCTKGRARSRRASWTVLL